MAEVYEIKSIEFNSHAEIVSASRSFDNKTTAIGTVDGSVQIWKNGESFKEFKVESNIFSISFMTESPNLLSILSMDGMWRVYDLNGRIVLIVFLR